MTGKLADKVVLVTGGSGGIGLGIAKHLSEEGAREFITGRRPAELNKAVASIGENVAAVQGAVSDPSDLNRIFAHIRSQVRRIDVLLANAGFYAFGTLGEITKKHFDRTFNTNVRGLLFTVQKALPLLSQGSSLVLTGSTR
jgi:NAD(P)-dependent dehydrogenase (short-subunit alcohol dehydrogenase family)